jgi:DNA-binding NtrC family response regulator
MPLTLAVDRNPRVLSRIRAVAQRVGHDVIVRTEFLGARAALRTQDIAIVVVNVRLDAFNGIHLAYLAHTANGSRRTIVFAAHHDPVLALEVQKAGAFYERQSFLARSLRQLLTATLPPYDRRDVTQTDRRTAFRGGRRSTDVSLLHPTAVSIV